MNIIKTSRSAPLETIQSSDFRKQLGNVLNRVYYQGSQIRIIKNKQLVVRLVPEQFMVALDEIMENEPGLADTLALMLNPEIKTTIKKGLEDYEKGNVVSLDEAFK